MASAKNRFMRSRIGMCTVRWASFCQRVSPLLQCGMILFYRLMLDLAYITVLSPNYSYGGFSTQIIPLIYALSWLILLVCLPICIGILRQESRSSSVLVTIINVCYFIPMTSFLGCHGTTIEFLVVTWLYWLALLLLQWFIPSFTVQKIFFARAGTAFKVLTIAVVVLVIGVSGYYTGFRLHFNIIDVYDVRSEAAAYNIPTVLEYALSMMSIVLSILIIFWLQKRRWIVVAILAATYFLYFFFFFQKSVFFFLILTLACYFLYREWMYRILPAIMAAGVFICWVAQSVFDWIWPLSLFVRRLLYIPVSISQSYYEYFSVNPLNFFREGVLGRFGYDSIYSDRIVEVIGEYEGTFANANNGLIGDMCANLPLALGVLIMPLILVVCFRLLDVATTGLPKKLYFALCIYVAFGFINSSWSTVLLTTGFLAGCGLFYVFPLKETVKNADI